MQLDLVFFFSFPRKISVNQQLKQTFVLLRVLTGALWVSVGSGEVKAQTERVCLWGRNVLLDTLTKKWKAEITFSYLWTFKIAAD